MSNKPISPFSKATHFLINTEVNVVNTISFMSQVNLTQIERLRASLPSKPSYTSFVIKALAKAMIEFPYVNRRVYHKPFLRFFLREQKFEAADICVAVERFLPNEPAAVFAEVLRSPNCQSIETISKKLADLAGATLENNQQWADFHKLITGYPFWLGPLFAHFPFYFPNLWTKYRGAAAMVSSPAKYGVDQLVGWWTHPIGVSFGYAEKRPVVINDKLEIAKTFTLSLNWDRRLMGGAQAAQFFSRLVEILENAETELVSDDPIPTNLDSKIKVSIVWQILEKLFSVGKR